MKLLLRPISSDSSIGVDERRVVSARKYIVGMNFPVPGRTAAFNRFSRAVEVGRMRCGELYERCVRDLEWCALHFQGREGIA